MRRFNPQVGQVIKQLGVPGSTAKRIMSVDAEFIYCRAGHNGLGRRSRISRKRLGDYSVIRDAPPSS
jgi:hypothetical protein